MTTKHPNPHVAKVLRRRTQTETQYYVPTTGNGTTTDQERAEHWARRSSENYGYDIPVLTRTVTFPAWAIVGEERPPSTDVQVTFTQAQARVLNDVLALVTNDPDWAEMLGSHRDFSTAARAHERLTDAMSKEQ